MSVRRAENSGTPATVDRLTDVKDGTTNTVATARKAENPFSKDVFESVEPHANSLCTNEIIVGGGITSPKGQLSDLKSQDDQGIEKPPAKNSFMDYTDDSCD